MTESGYRGYISSRHVRNSHYPQRVQNLVVRDYAQRRGLPFLLSVAEYAMPGCTMMLESLIEEPAAGIILFSMFVLPVDPRKRRVIYERVIEAGKTLHSALEQLVLESDADIDSWEEILTIEAILGKTPFAGRYEKSAAPLGTATDALIERFLTP